MTNYSNPRMAATIDNWPMGGSKQGVARFHIEVTPKGERGVRVTNGAPRILTYACKARIVDGDDGRTYIAELTKYGFISIMRGDFKYEHETIHGDDPRYRAALALFDDN